MDGQYYTLLDNLLTQGVQMVFLRLMVLCRWDWWTSDGTLQSVTRDKIRHYLQFYRSRPDPTAFIPVTVDTSGRNYDDFSRLLFFNAHHETSVLTNELLEKSDQFHFLRVTCLSNLTGSVGLTLAKALVMRISIPLDLSSRPFIPLPRFIRSRRPIPLLDPSLVLFPPRSV